MECLASKRKVLLADFKEHEDTESFERNCQLCLLPIKYPCLHLTFRDHDYGSEQSFSFTSAWIKENKTVKCLQNKALQPFVFTYMLPTE